MDVCKFGSFFDTLRESNKMNEDLLLHLKSECEKTNNGFEIRIGWECKAASHKISKLVSIDFESQN